MPFAPGFFPNNIASKEFVREAARNQAVAIQDALAADADVRLAALERRLMARIEALESDVELLKGQQWVTKRAEVLTEKRGPGRPRKDAA
jgi:hypothetical protein